MYRAGKLKVNILRHHSPIRPMSLAKRLLNAGLLRSTTTGSGGSGSNMSPTAQVSGLGQLQKQQQQTRDEIEQPSNWPRKIFSGIQPTGSLHLGNYLGAVRRWTKMQNSRDDCTICIVDMHSITLPHNPPVLREHIFEMAATLLACGIDPSKTTLFVQSAVLEHCEFNWILSSLTNMPRLAQLPQFKEKSRKLRDVPLGLYIYPVLQAADIMLYKSTHVPVGADQLQHIQLAQHLARTFNSRYGEIFPVCQALVEKDESSRVLSLRDPSKKMSKSDASPKGTINVCDPPDLIAEKIKKAVTDFTSDISYSPGTRPGVSNLVSIHSQVTGQSIKTIVDESKQLDTGRYKERVAEAVIEHLRPIREQIQQHLSKRNELIYMLEIGAEKARQCAQQTMNDVKQRLGLGTNSNLPAAVHLAPLLPERSKMTASQMVAKASIGFDTVVAHGHDHPNNTMVADNAFVVAGSEGETITGEQNVMQMPKIRRPVVPMQTMRVEKLRPKGPPKHVFKLDTCNVPTIGFRSPPITPSLAAHIVTGGIKINHRPTMPSPPGGLGFSQLPHVSIINNLTAAQVGGQSSAEGNSNSNSSVRFNGVQNANPSAVASITSAVNAAAKQQEIATSLANSAFYKATVAAYNNNSGINIKPSHSMHRISDPKQGIVINSGGSHAGSSSQKTAMPNTHHEEDMETDESMEEEQDGYDDKAAQAEANKVEL